VKKNKKRQPRITYRMGKKRLVDKQATASGTLRVNGVYDTRKGRFVSQYDALLSAASALEPENEGKIPAEPPTREPVRPSAMTAVMEACFDGQVPVKTRRKLQHGQALAVILLVPTADWVSPMARFFKQRFGSRWVLHSRDGSNRRTHSASVGNDEISADLARGVCVAGISTDVSVLPRALASAADMTIRIMPPDASVLRTATARFTMKFAPSFPATIGAGLDLHEILAAFRPGTGPQRIMGRLAAATAIVRGEVDDERLPALEDAVEYGEARMLGLQLAEDITALRENRIKWKDLLKGICLAGEPGVGKSLFARILARQCGIPLVSFNVADLFKQSGYLDETLRALNAVFDRSASLANPCSLLFIDECDGFPSRQSLGSGSQNDASRNRDYWLPLLGQLFCRLDNAFAASRGNIIVIAATNEPQSLDPALLRPGRFERVVRIERPDAAGVENILKFHVAGDLPDGEVADVARMIERLTGAEIMELVREARRIARQAGRPLAAADLRKAALSSEVIPAAAEWRICVHEAAHAVAAMAIGHGRVSHCVVGARAGMSDRTLIALDDGGLPTRSVIEARVTVLLAGRSAERLLLQDGPSVGAGGDIGSDLAAATAAVASLHLSYGMAETIAYHGTQREALEAIRYDAAMRTVVEADLQRLQRRAEVVVKLHREAVLAIAEALRSARHLSGDALRILFDAHPASRSPRLRSITTASRTHRKRNSCRQDS
jgi:cell division protease FtsH